MWMVVVVVVVIEEPASVVRVLISVVVHRSASVCVGHHVGVGVDVGVGAGAGAGVWQNSFRRWPSRAMVCGRQHSLLSAYLLGLMVEESFRVPVRGPELA